jgi:hypothetical protein
MNWAMPFGHDWYDLLKDMGSLIGGVLALIAGFTAYGAGLRQAHATLKAVDKQIEAGDRKDRLQAHCIAVGVYPDLLWVRVRHERASKIIRDEFPKSVALTHQLVEIIHSAKIETPPLINRNLDHLYVLKDAGSPIIQLFSVIIQYNAIIDTLAKQSSKDVNGFDARASAANLSGHLIVIARLLEESEQKIEPYHAQSNLG